MFGSCNRTPPQESVPEYRKPFSKLQKEKEEYVNAQVKKYGSGVLEDEGGAYREYMRWLRFWQPRIGPNGTYQSYNKNLKDYYDAHLKDDQSKSLSSSAPGNMDKWKELGPFVTPTGGIPFIGSGGQRGVGIIQSLVINRLNPNKLLCNSLAGGLFFSDDKGVNWTNAGSDAWFRSGCAAAAFAPDNETTWYAGSNWGGSYYRSPIGSVGGIYRTTNSGLSWDIIADRSTFNSTNPVNGEATIIHGILIDPKHPNIGYLGTNVGLYKSSNINTLSPSSVIWELVKNGSVEDMEFTTDTSATSTLLISYLNSGVWDIAQSIDQGSNWSSLPSPASFYVGTAQVVLEVTDAASNLLYVLNRKATGQLWVFNRTSSIWTPKMSMANAVSQGHGLGVSNFNANIVYVGRSVYLDKSTDGGSTFFQIPASTYHNDVEDIVTPHANCASCSNEVYVSTHGGVNYSPDEMATPLQSRSSGLGVAAINGGSGSQGNPARIAMGVDHDGSMVSHGSYGSNWIPAWDTVYGGDGGQALIDYSDGNYVWAQHQQSVHLLSSTGGGAGTYSSTAFAPPNDFYSKIAQNQLYPEVVYSKSKTHTGIGFFEDLFRSKTRGFGPIERISDFKTTHSLAANHFIFGMYPSPSDPDVMYVTEDQNGAPWESRLFRNKMMTAQDSVVTANWVALSFPHQLHGGPAAVGLQNPNIVYFSYAGYSWQSAEFYKADYTTAAPAFTNFAGTLGSGGLPNTWVASIVLEKRSNGGIYAATDVGVFYTNNKMINWTNPSASQWIRVGTDLPNIPLANMDINYTANKIRAYTLGRGVWEHDLVCPSDLALNFTGTQTGNAFHEAVNQITSTATVSSANSITYRAGTYAELSPGFIASPDNVNSFYAFIHPCNRIGNSP